MSQRRSLAKTPSHPPGPLDSAGSPLAVNSYDVALKRFDAMDGRLQTILAFIVATSAIIPAVAANRGLRFQSNYFYAAFACFIVAVIAGTAGRLFGRIKVLVPREAFNHWLHKPDWEFKMDFINQAAIDFEINVTMVERKCNAVSRSLFCFSFKRRLRRRGYWIASSVVAHWRLPRRRRWWRRYRRG